MYNNICDNKRRKIIFFKEFYKKIDKNSCNQVLFCCIMSLSGRHKKRKDNHKSESDLSLLPVDAILNVVIVAHLGKCGY